MKQCYSKTRSTLQRGGVFSWLRSFVLLLLFTAVSGAVMAQGTVKGTVKDEAGNPMIGVAVSVPGTSIGVSTDAAGNYVIKASGDQKLQFNYLGYKPQVVSVDSRSVVDVVMDEDNTSLDEVVVVGYGVQKKRDVIGSVETLSADKLDGRLGQYQNAARSLQGAIPGMTVSFSDGKPNRGATMRIRGNETSIGMGGDALVLVDGVEQSLETVNPEDIESFTVLKDASSAAVYGVRGAFGVVLVTTKNPDKGSAKISYNGSFSLYQRTVTPQMVTNGYDWTTSFLESYINRSGNDPANINNIFPFSRQWYSELAMRNSDPSYEKWSIGTNGRYQYYGNTNWYDLFYRDVAVGHTHSVTVQGGGDKASYYINGRYFYQDGMYREGNEFYDQYNVTARGTVKVRPW
ncbi:MAG: carboxypeptidase-like regulatory domain-containing protein, partial [Alistipes sp.]|nr:carboxypeptidase-like regulatory domain-containing protein [Alistipes sp.]